MVNKALIMTPKHEATIKQRRTLTLEPFPTGLSCLLHTSGNCLAMYRKLWLLGACAYNFWRKFF